MRVLLTGANGQLGRCIQKNVPANWELFAENKDVLDISDHDLVLSKVSEFKPNIIINAAAYTAVDLAEKEQEKSNIINNISVRNIAKIANDTRAIFVHVSTDYVFDGLAPIPYLENDQTNPLNVYGRTKLSGEKSILEVCPDAIIIRTAWVFSEFGRNFVKSMIKLGRTQNNIPVVNDQFGAPTYAGDIAVAIIALLEKDTIPRGVFHFNGDKRVSWYQFAVEIFEKARLCSGYPFNPKIIEVPSDKYSAPAKRPNNSVLNCDKIMGNGIALSNWSERLNEVLPLIIDSE